MPGAQGGATAFLYKVSVSSARVKGTPGGILGSIGGSDSPVQVDLTKATSMLLSSETVIKAPWDDLSCIRRFGVFGACLLIMSNNSCEL